MYFSNGIQVVTTITIIVMITFIAFHMIKGNAITKWGRRTAILLPFGLFVCCLAATRDCYHLSVQASFDDSVAAGLFTIQSMQSTLCCIGGGLIFLSGILTIFIKNQKIRRVLFYVMSIAILLKIGIIEISRICL